MTTAQDRQSRAMVPGDELHLSLLMAPHGLNLVTGQDRLQLLAYARDVWQAARALPAGVNPAFHGFLDPDECRVNLCFTPSAPRHDGIYATAYYTAAQVLAMGRVPACPLPCGWDGLHKIAVADGAYLARAEWPEDEEGVSVQRATVMRNIGNLIKVCRAMLAAPRPPAAQERKPGKNPHDFRPNKKYPWFCADCGYAPHDPLMHKQIKAAS